MVDESSDDEDGGGESECGVAVAVSAVGVAAELAVVGPPGVGGFDDPAQPESEPMRLSRCWVCASSLDVELPESVGVELMPDLGVVVAAIEADGVDVDE